ncbi:methylated-DNA--[protein]-cysteine S-methyltransferase [Youngiibacter fragilis]|uniref:Methylated-DNA--protein-cysteine methyltransferase n=1 Tax=Youngiibacter fragilis 232.1 TaxID=994573 RepID=V7I262_9CLOT|nr:methylated-DNA--protein-cysteine methyltransferase [Youngiibacter fragilis 232.1]
MKEAAVIKSNLGNIELEAEDGALTGLAFTSKPLEAPPAGSVLEEAARQLDEYFKGQRKEFTIPLAPHGTSFQERVWKELLNIPYGEAISYGELARRCDNPNAARAIGGAVGKNPIGVIIPCHRIISGDGTLGGYTGGTDFKKLLLKLEGVTWKQAD